MKVSTGIKGGICLSPKQFHLFLHIFRAILERNFTKFSSATKGAMDFIAIFFESAINLIALFAVFAIKIIAKK